MWLFFNYSDQGLKTRELKYKLLETKKKNCYNTISPVLAGIR